MTSVKCEDTGKGFRISATLNSGTPKERVFSREWSYAPHEKVIVVTPVKSDVLALAAAEFKALAIAEEARAAEELKSVDLTGTALG